MKKIIFTLLVVVLVTMASPAKASAAWWNPISWFKKTAVVTQTKPTNNTIELTGKESVVTVKIGDVIKVFGASASVTKVLEDSRCGQLAMDSSVKILI